MEYTCANILFTAQRLGAKSLSIPALSCGESGFSRKKCARILYKSIIKYQQGTLEDEQQVEEQGFTEKVRVVRLVHRRRDNVELFQKELDDIICAL